MDNTSNTLLGPRFEKALEFALHFHKSQLRKTSGVPYISHLLAVTALVLQDGGSEDEAIVALLHDAPEDQGGKETLDLIKDNFGEKVAEMVEVCSDTFELPKPLWQPRKEAHLKEIKKASSSVHRVILADKLHNSRSLLRDLKNIGSDVWKNFKGGKEGSLWYLKSMHRLLTDAQPGYLSNEFGKVLTEIERLSADS